MTPLPCLLYRLGFNLFLSLPSGKLVSVQCLPSNHLCDDQHPISELQCMENWSRPIPGSAPALYLMCLCAVGRCLFFFLSFSFCFFWSLNWNRENQNRVPSMVPDLLMPPTSPSFLLWPPRGPKNMFHTSPGPVPLPPPLPASLPPPPSSSLATVDLFVQREW